jgi:chromate transporter
MVLGTQPVLTLSKASRTWARVALLSFGGPAGQIAVMHRILVDEKRWIGEERFLHALNFCMLLPGPEAQQLAIYIGWLMHGTRGGLVAGTLFVLPGFIAIMAFSLIYVTWGYQPVVAGIFLGLKAAVVALILQAILRIGRRALRSQLAITIAVLAFVALFVLHAPFPLIIIAAGIFGYLWTRAGHTQFLHAGSAHAPGHAAGETNPADDVVLREVTPSAGRALTLLGIWLPLWLLPVATLALVVGPQHVFTQVGVFFSKMAVVTFGGAYAVLAYVAQAAQQHAWVTPTQMLDGLGLAESTPGPLIVVVQFVGFLAAYQTPGISQPLLAAVFAACLTVWVTFVPCFLWIFLGAPYIELLRQNRALSGALAAITAAVVGVILNLALWFALHAVFAEVEVHEFGPLRLEVPATDSVRWSLLLLIALANVMTFLLKWNMSRMLAICAACGIGLILWN